MFETAEVLFLITGLESPGFLLDRGKRLVVEFLEGGLENSGVLSPFFFFFAIIHHLIQVVIGPVYKGSLTVFAAFADTERSASNSALVALAVLLEASAFLAVASLGVEALLNLDLWLEGVGVSVQDCVDGHLSFLVVLDVAALKTVAFRATDSAICKAVAVQFEALGLLAVAGVLGCDEAFII